MIDPNIFFFETGITEIYLIINGAFVSRFFKINYILLNASQIYCLVITESIIAVNIYLMDYKISNIFLFAYSHKLIALNLFRSKKKEGG